MLTNRIVSKVIGRGASLSTTQMSSSSALIIAGATLQDLTSCRKKE
jgi:hypothetical protein